MEYMTVGYIKAHSRIDYDCEDNLIELYGAAAEKAVLNLLNCSVEKLKQSNGGTVPQDVISATFEIADNLIRHRSPTENSSMSIVPNGFDMLLKPYMNL